MRPYVSTSLRPPVRAIPMDRADADLTCKGRAGIRRNWRNERLGAAMLGGAQLLEEAFDLAADGVRGDAQPVGHRLDRGGVLSRVVRGLADAVDLDGGLDREARGGLGAARDLLRRGALLGDGGGDGLR